MIMTILDELVNNCDNNMSADWFEMQSKEQAQNKPPKSARLLFKYLTEMQGE